MRGLTALLALPLLSGCLSFDTRSGPGKVPKGASGVGYTVVDPARLAECVASSLGSTVTQNGNVYTVTAGQTTYSAEATRSAGVYPTQLVVRGDNSDKERSIKVNLCLNGTPAA